MNMILLRQGDDSNALGGKIQFNLKTEIDLSGYSAVFQLCDFQQRFTDIASKRLDVVIPSGATAKLQVGRHFGALKIFDSRGLCKTIYDNIPFYIRKQVVD